MARAAVRVRSVVERNGIDLVVANGPRILPAVIGARAAIVFHLHSRLEKWYARAIARGTLRARQATVICCCRSIAAPLTAKPGTHAVRVVYNGVSDTGFAPKPPGACLRVGIVGRIAPEKGHLDFVNAAGIVARSQSGVRFVILGASLFSAASYETEVRALARNLPVDFHGWTANVPRALQELDILVAPSAALEASPRVIMEAMAAGTPVIAYPSGGITELIRHGETGILTDRRDPESLAAAIELLLPDSDLRLRLAANARLEWEARFRVERFQREVCESFEFAWKRYSEQRGQTQAAAAIARKNDLA
jgi:glycosyltransferase involved in cell wall biosynthesis